jgi:hypothetical protein
MSWVFPALPDLCKKSTKWAVRPDDLCHGLLNHKPEKDRYEFGCNVIELKSISQSLTPVLKSLNNRIGKLYSAITEERNM